MQKGKVKSQKSEVLHYMSTHKRGITQLQAWEKFGTFKLPDIIYKLRQEGYEICSEAVTTKNRYGHTCTFYRYFLA